MDLELGGCLIMGCPGNSVPGEELAPAYFLGNRATGQGRATRGRAENLPGVAEITRVLYCTPQINIFPKVKW